MDGHLVTLDGKELELSTAEIERLLASSTPFWLDLLSTPPGSSEQELRRMQAGVGPPTGQLMVLYRALDMLIDGYFPVLAVLDDQIDELEDEILQSPTDEQLGRLFDMKRSLIALRKIVTPERDMFATLVSGSSALPGMTPEYERYFRDLYDHLIRVSDLVDSYRDLLSGAMDTHLSTVSNRLNVVMKQLTIIATIFLPLSFLTGFFGQNFGWMVTRLGSLAVFLAVGIGAQILTVIGLVVMFRTRGWLSSDGTVPGATPAVRHRPGPHMRWLYIHAMRDRVGAPHTVTPATGQPGTVPDSSG